MSNLKLGDRVRYSAVLHRESIRRSDGAPGDYKAWVQGPVGGAFGSPDEEREGIVYGLRTYTNGETVWGYSDEWTTYQPQESIAVALVAHGLRRKPDVVLVADLEVC